MVTAARWNRYRNVLSYFELLTEHNLELMIIPEKETDNSRLIII